MHFEYRDVCSVKPVLSRWYTIIFLYKILLYNKKWPRKNENDMDDTRYKNLVCCQMFVGNNTGTANGVGRICCIWFEHISHCDSQSEEITYQIQICIVARLVTSETTAQCLLYPSIWTGPPSEYANYLHINKETFDMLLKKLSHVLFTMLLIWMNHEFSWFRLAIWWKFDKWSLKK